jgi:hypothetical protein|tara:strand:- start:22253 stop:22492 length:240 start_codon:yes stop_codon:yes gene_type:complete
MRRLLVLVAAAVISTPLFAMHCPLDMAKIDERLESNPPTDAAVLEQVQSLRAEGQQLHESGKHAESVKALGQAQSLLDG